MQPVDSPLTIAWQHNTAPFVQPNKTVGRDNITGTCSHCGVEDVVYAVKHVASYKFAAWDEYTDCEGEPVWCRKCSWGFTQIDRGLPWLIEKRDGGVVDNGRGTARNALLAPLADKQSLVYPVGRKKNLLPYARWGAVTVDAGCFPWRVEETRVYRYVIQFRERGYNEAMLKREAPEFTILKKHPEVIVETMNMWGECRSYAAKNPDMWELIILLSRPVKEGVLL